MAIGKKAIETTVEEITVTVETECANDAICAKVSQILIGQEAVRPQGVSISILLRNMQDQGWNLARAVAYPHIGGTHVEYYYKRPVVTAAVAPQLACALP